MGKIEAASFATASANIRAPPRHAASGLVDRQLLSRAGVILEPTGAPVGPAAGRNRTRRGSGYGRHGTPQAGPWLVVSARAPSDRPRPPSKPGAIELSNM